MISPSGFRATGSVGAVAGPPDAGDDSEGARLIALNMAQNGTYLQDRTNRWLLENFSLRDRASLLDEVYSSVENSTPPRPSKGTSVPPSRLHNVDQLIGARERA